MSKNAGVHTRVHTFSPPRAPGEHGRNRCFCQKWVSCTPVTRPTGAHSGKKWTRIKTVIFRVEMSKNAGVHTRVHTFSPPRASGEHGRKQCFCQKWVSCTPVTRPRGAHSGKKWTRIETAIFRVEMSKNAGVHTRVHPFFQPRAHREHGRKQWFSRKMGSRGPPGWPPGAAPGVPRVKIRKF